MADGEDGQRDPPTVPERLPDIPDNAIPDNAPGVPPPGRARSALPPPELPGSANKFVVTVMVIGVVLAFAILVVIATSMGGSDGRRGDSAEPAAVSSESAQPSDPAASEAPPTPTDNSDSDNSDSDSGGSADGGAGTDDGDFELEDITHVTVPDVVGMDLQSAQEELFPRLRTTSVDATGEDRMQLVDSNWIVVRMDPPAGEQVPRLTDVTLYAVKEGESPRP